jgi:hypothetical protein
MYQFDYLSDDDNNNNSIPIYSIAVDFGRKKDKRFYYRIIIISAERSF